VAQLPVVTLVLVPARSPAEQTLLLWARPVRAAELMEPQEAAEVEPPMPVMRQPILNANQQAAEAQLITVPRTGEPGSGELQTILIGVEVIQTAAMTTMTMAVR